MVSGGVADRSAPWAQGSGPERRTGLASCYSVSLAGMTACWRGLDQFVSVYQRDCLFSVYRVLKLSQLLSHWYFSR